jgi:hypothetical protein
METAITKAAYELTIKFQDESDIPQRLKKGKSQNPSKQNLDSLVEQRFQIHVMAWAETINSILNHVPDKHQGWRFIRCTPRIMDNSIVSVVFCKDFIDFTDLLVQRRDIDRCDADELGKICMLHTAFQRVIESKINQ